MNPLDFLCKNSDLTRQGGIHMCGLTTDLKKKKIGGIYELHYKKIKTRRSKNH